jgi:hypothetical protein
LLFTAIKKAILYLDDIGSYAQYLHKSLNNELIIFAKVGKSILSILILIASFFFSEEAQAHALPGEVKVKMTVAEQNNHEILSAIANAHRFALEQNLIRVVPASRCGQVHKNVGNGHWAVLSLSAATFSSHALSTCANLVATSSYLSHIYPSHNFW